MYRGLEVAVMNYEDVGESLGGNGNALYLDCGSIPFVQIHRYVYTSGNILYILFYVNYEVIKRNTIRAHRILPSMKMV